MNELPVVTSAAILGRAKDIVSNAISLRDRWLGFGRHEAARTVTAQPAPSDKQEILLMATGVNYKVRCNCGWRGDSDSLLVAMNPFEPTEEVWGCPRCKSMDELERCCDEPDCWQDASCGTPTKDGYRHTCGKHRPV